MICGSRSNTALSVEYYAVDASPMLLSTSRDASLCSQWLTTAAGECSLQYAACNGQKAWTTTAVDSSLCARALNDAETVTPSQTLLSHLAYQSAFDILQLWLVLWQRGSAVQSCGSQLAKSAVSAFRNAPGWNTVIHSAAYFPYVLELAGCLGSLLSQAVSKLLHVATHRLTQTCYRVAASQTSTTVQRHRWRLLLRWRSWQILFGTVV